MLFSVDLNTSEHLNFPPIAPVPWIPGKPSHVSHKPQVASASFKTSQLSLVFPASPSVNSSLASQGNKQSGPLLSWRSDSPPVKFPLASRFLSEQLMNQLALGLLLTLLQARALRYYHFLVTFRYDQWIFDEPYRSAPNFSYRRRSDAENDNCVKYSTQRRVFQ